MDGRLKFNSTLALSAAVNCSSKYQRNCSSAYDDGLLFDGGRDGGEASSWLAFMTLVLVLYGLICCVGIFGNGLVMVVVLRFAKMRSVTNTYIFNLALSDFLFLLGLPFLIVTAVRRMWIFGHAMCKVFFVMTSLNQFTSVLTLTVMSADRYLAVCHAIASMRYRTPTTARVVCFVVWVASFLVMLPIILYAKTVEYGGDVSCTIEWPKDQAIREDHAFIWYAFCLSFAIPVSLISVFYFLVVLRLKSTGPNKNTKGKKRSQKKVTVLVLAVVTVYVVCWLPYWIFQATVLFFHSLPFWAKLLFQLITILSYANSTLNPLLYAFLSDNFRQTFVRAFQCASSIEVNRVLVTDQLSTSGSWRSHSWSRARSFFSSARRKSEHRKSKTASGSTRRKPAAAAVAAERAVEMEELVEGK